MATLVVNDIAIFKVPGAFLQINMAKGKNVVLNISDEFVDILCKVNPEYKEHVRVLNGRKVLYVKILGAIYGCIESEMIWFNLYSNTMKGMEFKLNPYVNEWRKKLSAGSSAQFYFMWMIINCLIKIQKW